MRSETTHSNSNRPGSVESGPISITLTILGPVGPIFGPTGPNISIVIVFNNNRARPGPVLLLCTFSLRGETHKHKGIFSGNGVRRFTGGSRPQSPRPRLISDWFGPVLVRRPGMRGIFLYVPFRYVPCCCEFVCPGRCGPPAVFALSCTWSWAVRLDAKNMCLFGALNMLSNSTSGLGVRGPVPEHC